MVLSLEPPQYSHQGKDIEVRLSHSICPKVSLIVELEESRRSLLVRFRKVGPQLVHEIPVEVRQTSFNVKIDSSLVSEGSEGR